MTQPSPPGQPTTGQAQAALYAALGAEAASAFVSYSGAAGLFAALRPKFRQAGFSDVALMTAIEVQVSFPAERIEGIGPGTRWATRANLARRVAFFLNSAQRIQGDLARGRATGRPLAQTISSAISGERRFFRQHVAASYGRTVAGARVDSAAQEYGGVLGWHAERDSHTSPECLAAHGKNFHADQIPLIGYPGTVHPACRCLPVRAYPGAAFLPTAHGRVIPGDFAPRRVPRVA